MTTQKKSMNSENTRPASLTDPADLMALGGRFFLSIMFAMFAVTFFLGGHPAVAAFFALLGVVLQVATIRMWRRLRDERLAKKAALSVESENQEASRQ